MVYKRQRVRDPLHNVIQFEAEEFEDALWSVICTRPFQRLRRIKQLGFSDLVYPGATHTRFAHSIGVFHTARQLMKIIENKLGSNKSDVKIKRALCASLVHDLGHGPFSHAFETVGKKLGLKMADHEVVSDTLIRNSEVSEVLNDRLGSGFANDVADIIKSSGPSTIYHAVVSSQFDADRLDYMRRDRLMTGTNTGEIDFDWLLANLEVGSVPYGVDQTHLGNRDTFVLGSKAFYAAETYVLGLFQLYPTVYLHKTTRSAETIFTELLHRTVSLIREGSSKTTGLPDFHPIVMFANKPDDIECVLQLDDTVFWGALSMMADATDKIVSAFAKRLRDRELLECIDVREKLIHAFGQSGDMEGRVVKACISLKERVEEWKGAAADRRTRILVDEGSRDTYKEFQDSKGPLNQIRIKTMSGDLVDLGEHSKVVKASDTFRYFRIYVARDDTEAKAFVLKTLGEVRNGTGQQAKAGC